MALQVTRALALTLVIAATIVSPPERAGEARGPAPSAVVSPPERAGEARGPAPSAVVSPPERAGEARGPAPSAVVSPPERAGEARGPASSIVHPPSGHGAHVSAPALVVDREGPLVAWMAQDGHDNVVYAARPGAERVRVSPPSMSGDSLHQAPGIATGPAGEIYITWASRRPKPVDGLFASDLQLSRSMDGGTTFEAPLRVSDDAPTSHSFEGLAVAPDGTVLIAWIETRSGARPGTYFARVTESGRRVESTVKLDNDETCVCCRVSLAAAAPDVVTVFWRKVFPGDVRDMVLARSRDGGRTMAPAVRVHADNWRITACPHRGGSVAMDGRGRVHALWYTEGTRNEPDVLYAVAADGQRFGTPRRVHVSATSIPDHARLAVAGDGRGVIVWEDATAVRRRVLLREVTAGGLGPVRVLSQAVKAYAPDVTIAPDGGAVVAWHEEQFPSTKTMTLRLGAADTGGRTR